MTDESNFDAPFQCNDNEKDKCEVDKKGFPKRANTRYGQEDAIVSDKREVLSNLLDVKVSLEDGLKKYPGNEILANFVRNVNDEIQGIAGDDFEITQKKAQKLAQDIRDYRLDLDHKHIITMDKTIGNGDHFDGLKEAQTFMRGKDKFAKIWLLNAQDINGNGWGVAASTLDTNIMKFIGRPFVVTAQDFIGKPSPYGNQMVHPSLPTMSVAANLRHQEQFRVGTIVDVIKEGTEYFAQIKILPKFHEKSLPPFCSPAVFQADLTEDERNFSKWEALHLAGLMEKPAYGARIAILKGTCIGTQSECRVQFSQNKNAVMTAQLIASTICPIVQNKFKLLETKLKLLE